MQLMKLNEFGLFCFAFTVGISCSISKYPIEEASKAAAKRAIDFISGSIQFGILLVENIPQTGLFEISKMEDNLFQYISKFNQAELKVENELAKKHALRALAAFNQLKYAVDDESIRFRDLLFLLQKDAQRQTHCTTAKEFVSNYAQEVNFRIETFPASENEVLSEINSKCFQTLLAILNIPPLISTDQIIPYLVNFHANLVEMSARIESLHFHEIHQLLNLSETLPSDEFTPEFTAALLWYKKNRTFSSDDSHENLKFLATEIEDELKGIQIELAAYTDEALVDYMNSTGIGRLVDFETPEASRELSSVTFTGLNNKKAKVLKDQILASIADQLKTRTNIKSGGEEEICNIETIEEFLLLRNFLMPNSSNIYTINGFLIV